MNPYHFDSTPHWTGIKARVLREREERAEQEHQAMLDAHTETDIGEFEQVKKEPFVPSTSRLKRPRGTRQE